MKLVCIYCSKELVLESSKEDQDKLENSFWFCSEYCKDTFVNIQTHKKRIEEGEKEGLQWALLMTVIMDTLPCYLLLATLYHKIRKEV